MEGGKRSGDERRARLAYVGGLSFFAIVCLPRGGAASLRGHFERSEKSLALLSGSALGDHMKHVFSLFFALVFVFVFIVTSTTAFAMTPPKKKAVPAETQSSEEAITPSPPQGATETTDDLPDVLDHRERPSRNYIGEFDVFFGDYLGDETKNTWGTGGRALLHVNHLISFGAEYVYAPMSVDASSVFGTPNYNKNQHIVSGQVIFNNEAAIAFGRKSTPLDLYLTVGGGMMNINNQWKWLAVVGGGLKIYVGPEWFALKFDVNSYIHPIPKASGDSINGDMAIWLGTAFHFPNKKAEAKKESE